MGEFRFLDDIAISDAAVEVIGESIEDLFETAAIAMFEVMVDTANIRKRIGKRIYLKAEEIDGLLFDWLSQLVYLKDAEGLFCSGYNIDIKQKDGFVLCAEISGEDIDPERHELKTDVKAVTYHKFEVCRRECRWIARVVFDT
ncbi:MAG: archease [Nitrospirota bacterium]